MGLGAYDDIERYMAAGWSDGLPVIPPYGSLAEDMLAAMGWDYTDVVSVVSGHSVGHIGPADIIVGFERLSRAGQLDGPVAVASSTPYSFGFGLITPPAG